MAAASLDRVQSKIDEIPRHIAHPLRTQRSSTLVAAVEVTATAAALRGLETRPVQEPVAACGELYACGSVMVEAASGVAAAAVSAQVIHRTVIQDYQL